MVSVVLPFRNAGKFLMPAVESVLKQTYDHLELLLIDDGSSDGGASRLGRIGDPRIRLMGDQRSLGLTTRLNQGIAAAEGRYVARMDADDICALNRLERQVSAMESDERLAVVGTAVAYIDSGGRVIGAPRRPPSDHHQITWRLLTSNCMVHPSTMLRSSVIKQHGYSPSYPVAQDFELWLRLAARGFRFANLPEILLLLRRHTGNVSTARREEQLQFSASALVEYAQSFFGVDIDADTARGLVDPPIITAEIGRAPAGPFDVLHSMAVNLARRQNLAGDSTFANFVRDDISFYAIRYLIRSLTRSSVGTSRLDVVGLRAAVNTVASNLPRAAWVSMKYAVDKLSATSSGRRIAGTIVGRGGVLTEPVRVS
jgi:glycosyltransferase involved in cell wall biosynthesis